MIEEEEEPEEAEGEEEEGLGGAQAAPPQVRPLKIFTSLLVYFL